MTHEILREKIRDVLAKYISGVPMQFEKAEAMISDLAAVCGAQVEQTFAWITIKNGGGYYEFYAAGDSTVTAHGTAPTLGQLFDLILETQKDGNESEG